MSNKTCLNCFNCKVRIELRPLSRHGGCRIFQHKDLTVADKLNSRMIYKEVYCTQNMWAKVDGTEFYYSSYARLMRNPTQSRMQTAETCLRYVS